ncbi:MAG TPA: hypothetical protein VE985_09870 [Gaiellaceae bacterium]|nr:hypothetical protein [Gaiellaceae bacterium]
MPLESDEPLIPENLACEIAGLAPSKRRDWVKRGLLNQPTRRAKLSELQVVHLAIARELHDLLGPRDGGIVWLELQPLLAPQLPFAHFDMVVDLGYREVTVVTDPNEIPALVRSGRPVRVISFDELVSRVSGAFKRVAASK